MYLSKTLMNELSWSSVTDLPAARAAPGANAAPAAPATAIFRKSRRDLPLIVPAPAPPSDRNRSALSHQLSYLPRPRKAFQGGYAGATGTLSISRVRPIWTATRRRAG